MNKTYYILIIIILLVSGCTELTEEIEYDIVYQPLIEKINYNPDSLILYELSSPYRQQKMKEIEFRGIDSYSCRIDSINGLEINMSFGFMSGQTFTITIRNDSLITNHRSWGCTSHESFKYETIQQEITLDSPINTQVDSIIGRISYIGRQDIQQKIDQWESYGENSDWLKNLKPSIAKINGQFKLKVHKHQSDHSNEYDRTFLYRKKQFAAELIEVAETKSDSISCKGMRLNDLPKEISKLKSIEILNMEGNKLNQLDYKKLTKLPELKKIYLGWNSFKEFPQNLTKNKNLRYVNLKGNPIESLPIQDLMKSKIKYLNLQGSKLSPNNLKELRTKMKVEI